MHVDALYFPLPGLPCVYFRWYIYIVYYDDLIYILRIVKTSHKTIYIYPIGCMYGIFTYIYHKSQPNVGISTIHGSYGWWKKSCTARCTWSLDPRAPHLTLVLKKRSPKQRSWMTEILHRRTKLQNTTLVLKKSPQNKEVEWLKSCTGAQSFRTQHWFKKTSPQNKEVEWLKSCTGTQSFRTQHWF